ncbi:MAG: DUF1810 domain-containing protein [Gemmataceae bacterium]|nr:DUF1810 domain-containing protein [Gemmataceae bacterium]
MANDDPHDLGRFLAAQDRDDNFNVAISEIKAGEKRSHWIWFVFPQMAGLGSSGFARRYAIRSGDEARAYLAHPVLGQRLTECAEAALGIEGRSAYDIFGSPDDLKVRSCATLFGSVSPAGSVFQRLLDKFYAGQRDELTVALLVKTEA